MAKKPTPPRDESPNEPPKQQRAPRGSGSINWSKAHNCWKGYTRVSGTEKYFYGQTKTEVARKIKDFEREYARTGVVPAKTTFGDFTQRWLEQRKPPAMPHKTWYSYEWLVRSHILPELGHLKVVDVRPVHIQDALTHIRNKTSQVTHKPISARTVQYARSLIHRILKEAWAAGLCASNCCDAVDGPKIQREPRIVWTEEELRRFLQTTHGTRFESLWSFLTVTGCRIQEALGLTWSDVDLETGKVLITRQLYREKGIELVKQPKSQAGIRTLCLPAPTVELLNQLRASQLDHETIVFATLGGQHLHYQNVLHVLRRECERAKVRRVSFHNFRHLAATYLIMLGLDPRSVAEFLGHSDKSLVMRTYAHAMSGHAERAASLLSPFVTLSENPSQITKQGAVPAGTMTIQPAKTATRAKPEQPGRTTKKVKRRRKLRAA